MICEECHGDGTVLVEGPDYLGRDGNCWRKCWEEPCPSCGGSGISSCCEGAVGLSGDIPSEI